jgi:hypothetical protein
MLNIASIGQLLICISILWVFVTIVSSINAISMNQIRFDIPNNQTHEIHITHFQKSLLDTNIHSFSSQIPVNSHRVASLEKVFTNISAKLDDIKKAISESRNPGWDSLITFISGAAVAVIGLIVGTIFIDYRQMPILSLDGTNSPLVSPIDIPLYDLEDVRIPLSLRRFNVRYRVNRISIRNNGPRAATNCKAILLKNIMVNKEEIKICCLHINLYNFCCRSGSIARPMYSTL